MAVKIDLLNFFILLSCYLPVLQLKNKKDPKKLESRKSYNISRTSIINILHNTSAYTFQSLISFDLKLHLMRAP
ncbi:MAG TPA: hypothetical protein DIC42_01595 [Holosporales bacterium]|nr:hypothetical protein [Holosporales bacterium]